MHGKAGPSSITLALRVSQYKLRNAMDDGGANAELWGPFHVACIGPGPRRHVRVCRVQPQALSVAARSGWKEVKRFNNPPKGGDLRNNDLGAPWRYTTVISRTDQMRLIVSYILVAATDPCLLRALNEEVNVLRKHL